MKAKFIVFAFIAAVLTACNSNEPSRKELIGTWSEPYHINTMVKTVTFNEDGTLIFSNKPDTTWNPVIDEAGDYAQLHYSVINHKLHFSGETRPYPSADTKPFAFTTDYSIVNNVLTIDSFSYDGGANSKFYKPLILYKSPK